MSTYSNVIDMTGGLRLKVRALGYMGMVLAYACLALEAQTFENSLAQGLRKTAQIQFSESDFLVVEIVMAACWSVFHINRASQLPYNKQMQRLFYIFYSIFLLVNLFLSIYVYLWMPYIPLKGLPISPNAVPIGDMRLPQCCRASKVTGPGHQAIALPSNSISLWKRFIIPFNMVPMGDMHRKLHGMWNAFTIHFRKVFTKCDKRVTKVWHKCDQNVTKVGPKWPRDLGPRVRAGGLGWGGGVGAHFGLTLVTLCARFCYTLCMLPGNEHEKHSTYHSQLPSLIWSPWVTCACHFAMRAWLHQFAGRQSHKGCRHRGLCVHASLTAAEVHGIPT